MIQHQFRKNKVHINTRYDRAVSFHFQIFDRHIGHDRFSAPANKTEYRRLIAKLNNLFLVFTV